VTCPPWCDNEHPTSGVHRGVIGRTTVGGERISVAILQVFDGPPSVMLSGPVIMEVGDLDHQDMATLLELAGQSELAGLVRRASEVMRAAQDTAPAREAG
jgi:hypothetical protein